MQVLYKDGKEVARGESDFDLIKYIHKNHSYSLSHALKHEGYEIKDTKPKKQKDHAFKKDVYL